MACIRFSFCDIVQAHQIYKPVVMFMYVL
jgi:hypothetical protein